MLQYLKRAGLSLCVGVLSEFGLKWCNLDSALAYDVGLSLSSLTLGFSVGESYARRDRESFIVSGMLFVMLNILWARLLRKKYL